MSLGGRQKGVELSESALSERVDVYNTFGRSTARAASSLGISERSMRRTLEAARAKGLVGPHGERDESRSFTLPDLPDAELDPLTLWNRREKEFTRRSEAEDARKLIPIKFNIDGPIAIAFFGDIHIDSPGCNLALLREHTELVNRTEGMFAGSIGDLQDGWVGRLARLWAMQGMSGKQALILLQKWVEDIAPKLVFICSGNHDAWAYNVNDTSPLEWIAGQAGVLHERDGVRLALDLPSGDRFTINARHDFRGRSQYNPAHGSTKAAMFGWRDDILIAGHTHQSGYNILKDPMTGRTSHALRIASYKHIDPYAKAEGLPDENVSECMTAIIDPTCADPRHRVSIEFNPHRAAQILTMLRKGH